MGGDGGRVNLRRLTKNLKYALTKDRRSNNKFVVTHIEIDYYIYFCDVQQPLVGVLF